MTVVPISMLSASDLCLLGINLIPRRRPAGRMSVAAVDRSLAIHDEQVDRLYVGTDRPTRQLRKVA